jgi:hypothetical protein
MRDGGVCQLRLVGCKGIATAVDHIVDWQDAPSLAFDMANLRAVCASCNASQRNARVAARARAQRKLSPRRGQYRQW